MVQDILSCCWAPDLPFGYEQKPNHSQIFIRFIIGYAFVVGLFMQIQHMCHGYGLPQRQSRSSLLRHMQIRNMEEEASSRIVQRGMFSVVMRLTESFYLLNDQMWLKYTPRWVGGG